MPINLDAVINTPDDTVDMKSGLDTLQGVSEVARCIAETILKGKVPERQSHKSEVRTVLKQSFRGSYGQIFSIGIYDQDAQAKLNQIGHAVFLELMAFFLNESVYKEHPQLSVDAQAVIDHLGDKVNSLMSRLRKTPLRRLHEVSSKFGYDVQLRYRRSRDEQTELARFDQATAATLSARLTQEALPVSVAITRLNINTGNGRLLVEGKDFIAAFGFSGMYARVSPAIKREISENLNYNNVRGHEAWQYINITARFLKIPDGRIVKYIITGVGP